MASDIPHSRHRFATTRWSVILAAQGPGSAGAQTALATLCETYWYPLYGYVRRQGYQQAEAQDLTQAFFARLLEKNDLRDVCPDRGRFRSFLLAAMKHFLANQRDYARALKRGGGRKLLSLDFERAEQRYAIEPADRRTPETDFDRQWALTLLEQTHQTLRTEFTAAGKEKLFEQLQGYLTGGEALPSYQEAAEALDMSPGAVKTAVHRLRRRFGELLRAQIRQTVDQEQEIDQEIQLLLKALQG